MNREQVSPRRSVDPAGVLWNEFHIAMRKKIRKRIIQVPIDAGFLSRIDETAGLVAESRAEFIRQACEERLRALEASKLDRRYVEGYRRNPEAPEWGEVNAGILARRLPREKW
ncbi:MAG: hypothetical protein ACREQ9_05165 [Candidatus Binatia bacterium]